MLFDRQKRLLALVDALGGSMANLDFQKLLFLYCQETEQTPTYEFVPYRFGGFSFTSYADRRRLIQRGLLADEKRAWTLTVTGRAAAVVSEPTHTRMLQFGRSYADLRGDALVVAVYRQYPYFAIRSEIAERVLSRDEATLAAIEAARPVTGKAGLCTIGYEKRSLEGYLNRLIQGGVTMLCDVRRNPLSRKYGFSKSTLAKSCEGVGISYMHLPELGIASEDRHGLQTQADYDALFEKYKCRSLPHQSGTLGKIRHWVKEGARVALTCFELLPQQCHRLCVAEALERSFGRAFAPLHL